MNDINKSIRYRTVEQYFIENTRFSSQDIAALQDTRSDYRIRIKLQQNLSWKVHSTEGKGRSGIAHGEMVGSKEEVLKEANAEMLRLQSLTEKRAEDWLASASTNLAASMPTNIAVSDMRTFGHDWGCNQCHTKGYLRCSHCDASGKVTCTTCGGKKEDTCKKCSGQGRNQCSACHGAQQVTCSQCGGSSEQSCSSCSGRGKNSCSGCGGRGSNQRWVDNLNSAGGGYVDDRCSSCYGSGSHNCTNCYGSGRTKCSNYACSNGKVDCTTCARQGYISCSPCRGLGRVTCNTCAGQGKCNCSVCGGSTRVACPKCNATGWHYFKAQPEVSINDEIERHFPSEMAAIDLERIKALGSQSYAQMGDFKLIEQYALKQPAYGLVRLWEGVISVWETKFSVSDFKFTTRAYGSQEKIDGLSRIVDDLLKLDQDKLDEALKSGSDEQISLAIHTFCQSKRHVEHLKKFLEEQRSEKYSFVGRVLLWFPTKWLLHRLRSKLNQLLLKIKKDRNS